MLIRIDEKRFADPAGGPPTIAVAAFACALPAGSFTVLFGPSGCGKTTILNLVAGLDRDYRGHIERPAGGRLGYVFQEPRLLPWRTAEANVRLVLADGEADARLLDELFGTAGLGEARGVMAGRLSLGMARRVALVRAFAVRPTLLLMDEPFVSLDLATADRLRALLRELLAHHPATVLFVTHDAAEAGRLADRILLLGPRPATLRREIAVTLSPAERSDTAAVAAFCRDTLDMV